MSQVKSYDFFQNTSCEYFPCHQTDHPERFNCMFCYCPLYALGRDCGGDFVILDNGIKDCTPCLKAHEPDFADEVARRFSEIDRLIR